MHVPFLVINALYPRTELVTDIYVAYQPPHHEKETQNTDSVVSVCFDS